MEFLGELLLFLLQMVFEFLIQVILQFLAEFGFRSTYRLSQGHSPAHPFLAAIGYAASGAIAGGFSLVLFPTLFMESPTGRILNLIITPIAAGHAMSALGAWRARHKQVLVRLDHFGYGFVFAFAMALVRFYFGGSQEIINAVVPS